MSLTIARHCVPSDPQTGLSPLQTALLNHPARIRIADAPTGAGKSYAFQRAMLDNEERVLFVVPTRRLAQNLARFLSEDLEAAGWEEKKRRAKMALWNSDATKSLQEEGLKEIGARRIREIYELDTTRRGGEMIITVPEVVSNLLLRYRSKQGQSDAGIFDFLTCFDHLVFDEFHTITARGFGLAAVFAKLAAEYSAARTKVSFLSATPLNIQPVLAALQVPIGQIAVLREEVSSEGRAIHGDVTLQLEESESLLAVLEKYQAVIQEEIDQQRQVVVIYNKVIDLQLQVPQLEQWVKRIGVLPQDCLLINSIDDSRPEVKAPGQFTVGRRQLPERFKLLIATSSVEIGVTFNARVLLMEPGFEPLNFLQRYGRAARGDFPGLVVVRWDKGLVEKQPWLRQLQAWITAQEGQEVQIQALTTMLSQQVMEAFNSPLVEQPKYFGELPSRAAATAGLYWYVLSKHHSNQGHREEHLRQYAPKQAKKIAVLLGIVRKMTASPRFARSAKQWCDRFEAEARVLRDIGRKIRVVNEARGDVGEAGETWLRRNTDILETGVWRVGEDGEEEVHYQGSWQSHLLDKGRYVPNQMSVLFPHTQNTASLVINAEWVKEWCRQLHETRGPASMAWELYQESMAAAEELVRWTGLVVCEEEEVEKDAASGVW